MKKKLKISLSNNFSILILLALLPFHGCRNTEATPFSKSAIEALSTFEIAPGFKMELVASEPFIFDPVAMSIDELGRMYVVEMAGMPLNKSGIGKVVLLSDTSHDGKMDKRTIFADSLIMPSGVMRWKKGIIVTDPPNVYYMEDTNGDGKADIKTTMLAGFDTSNLEGNVNNPIYGLDNWIYLANSPGIKGGNIHYADDPGGIRLNEGTVRIKPAHHQLELLAGKTQFGQTFDNWGNHFMLNNHFHIYQEVIAARYLNRNPGLVVSRATQLLPDHSEVFSIAKNPEYQMLTEIGVFTSACGLTAYLGGAFPEDYNNNTFFVAEPASNIVHVDRLQDSGVSFKAKRIIEKKEFVASTDPYSRIVNMYVGPDGALYLIDFYRQVIEGPEFMSEEVKSRTNLYNGNDKGRIYRISKEDAPPADWTDRLQLDKATSEQLVNYLDDKNVWWRLNAQRLLVDRNATDAVPTLIAMTKNANAPMGRLHALWTLQGINKLTPGIILDALKDPLPGIRINAIKLAEMYMAGDEHLTAALLAMENDPDIKVRFQLLCTLGSINAPAADKLRQDILFKDLNDKWVQVAALSANSSQAVALLNAVLSKYDSSVNAYASLVQLLGSVIAKSQPGQLVKQWIQKATPGRWQASSWQPPLLEGLAQGFSNRKDLPANFHHERMLLMQTCLENPSIAARKNAMHLLNAMGMPGKNESRVAMVKAEQIAGNKNLKEDERVNAIEFMTLDDPAPHEAFLKSLVNLQTPVSIQVAAVRTLGGVKGESVTKFLLDKWQMLTPQVRSEAINTFLITDQRTKLFLDKVESGEINKGAISWDQSVNLRSGGEQMNRARKLLTETDISRKDIIGQYQEAITMKGDVQKGKLIYQANCSMCHQVAGKSGRAFGPDLGTVFAWPPADILTNILDPNKSIALGFDLWTAKLNNGKTVQGIILSETPTAVTLTNAAGEVFNITREDIESMSALNMSAMPIDLEKKIDKKQMADLLAFLEQMQ